MENAIARRTAESSVLLHGRFTSSITATRSTKNGKGNAYPMLISYDPQSRKLISRCVARNLTIKPNLMG